LEFFGKARLGRPKDSRVLTSRIAGATWIEAPSSRSSIVRDDDCDEAFGSRNAQISVPPTVIREILIVVGQPHADGDTLASLHRSSCNGGVATSFTQLDTSRSVSGPLPIRFTPSAVSSVLRLDQVALGEGENESPFDDGDRPPPNVLGVNAGYARRYFRVVRAGE